VLIAAQTPGVVGRLAPVSDFRNLPASIARDLLNRQCFIPQVTAVSGRHNVIQGQFKKPGQIDWAVLCLRGKTSTILVYWNGSPQGVAQLALMDESITSFKNGYYRILQVAGEKFLVPLGNCVRVFALGDSTPEKRDSRQLRDQYPTFR